MPKLIDYPRTSYTGAWELAEIVDDTGGKCAIETAARKLNRKVSGSFKAIIGSAVKFGLMTSKRELLTTTTLFRRIKHAYDKAEELQFHREAFLTPPLFTQLCRKFRNRELPVQMLDVMLIREFGVEEINAQNVAKAFVDGCRMCGLLDERNIVADIDALATNRNPRRELSSTVPNIQSFTPAPEHQIGLPTNSGATAESETKATHANLVADLFGRSEAPLVTDAVARTDQNPVRPDAVASLFGFTNSIESPVEDTKPFSLPTPEIDTTHDTPTNPIPHIESTIIQQPPSPFSLPNTNGYQMQMSGPGINTLLDITDEDDLAIAIALLEKIRRKLKSSN